MGDRASSSAGGESLRNYFRRSLHKMGPDSDSMFCQNPKCSQGDAVTAVKVCHNCSSRPLLLCEACDRRAHSDLRSRGHMRFDLAGSSRPLGTPTAAALSSSSTAAAGLTAAAAMGAGSQTFSMSPASSSSGGSGSNQQLVPLHSRSMSLPDRRTASSAMLSFYEPSSQHIHLQAAAAASVTLPTASGHYRFPSTDEGSEGAAAADGSEEHSDLDGGGEPFDDIDGRYRRMNNGRFIYQVDSESRNGQAAAGEATYRPLTTEGGTKWIRAPSEILDQTGSKTFNSFTVYLHLTDGDPIMHVVPVEKGVKIRQALDRLLESHRLTFDEVEVYIGNNTSLTSLTGTGETSYVGGMVLRVFLPGKASRELARRSSNGSLPSSSSGTGAERTLTSSRVEDLRGSSSLDPASTFRKSSSANRLKPSTSASGGLSTASVLQGRSSYTNLKRGAARDSKQLDATASGGMSRRLLQLSENSSTSSTANQPDDGASEIGGRQVRKVASTAGFTLYTSDDSHHDVSPSGTISKRGGGAAAAVAQALTGRSSFLPALYKEKDKAERLTAKLEEWSLGGIPEMMDLSMCHLKLDPRLIELEEHWTRFISPDNMSSRQKDQQEALWELFTTEVEYMKSLRNVVIELFMSCLFNLQSDQLLNDVASDRLFGNVETVVDINIQWWQSSLLPVLQYSRQTHEPLNARLLKPAFTGFSQRFAPYTQYCLEQPICSKYLKRINAENDLFSIFVKWAQAQKQCNRLKLHDLLVKPMQRLTRYTLLLNAILKKTEDPDAKSDLVEMIEIVHTFVKDVDQTLHDQERAEKLSELVMRFDSYDAVDMPYNDAESSRLLAIYSAFDVKQPMPGCGKQLRHLLHDGPLKMKEGSLKSDVHCFLFTDIFLVTKVKRADRHKIIKAPIRVDQCVVEELGKDSNAYFLLIQLTEYGVAQAAYAFHGANLEKWVKTFKTAKEMYEAAKQNALRPQGVPLSPALLNGDGEDDMGFVGPDLPRVDSDGSNGEDAVGGGSATATLAVGGADSDDGGSYGVASDDRSGSGNGGEEYDVGDSEVAADTAAYSGAGYTYGSRASGAAPAAAAAAVTRSASSPVMSSRPKGSATPGSIPTRQPDSSDDRVGARRGRRYLTADTIQPFADAEQSAPGAPTAHDGYPSSNHSRSLANGQDHHWELCAGVAQSANFSQEANAAAGGSYSHSGGDGTVRTGAEVPRAKPRRNLPATSAGHHLSANGEAQVGEPGAAAGAAGFGSFSGAAGHGSCIDDHSPGVERFAGGAGHHFDGSVQSSVGGAESVQQHGSRSSRKLSQAELMRMRAQIFTASPHDGAEV